MAQRDASAADCGAQLFTCGHAIFAKLIEEHPSVVQALAMVEQLLTEAMGPDWTCTSLARSHLNVGL